MNNFIVTLFGDFVAKAVKLKMLKKFIKIGGCVLKDLFFLKKYFKYTGIV